MLVSDLIKSKGSTVASAPPDTPVSALLDLLAERGLRSWVCGSVAAAPADGSAPRVRLVGSYA